MAQETLNSYFCFLLMSILPVALCLVNNFSSNISSSSNSTRLNAIPDSNLYWPYEGSDAIRNGTSSSVSGRTSAKTKFLSIFAVIQFSNTMCTVGSLMGNCVTASECSSVYGGSNIGSCAKGYGTCCYKVIKCGESSSMNVTYIQNADYPSTTSSTGTCKHTINRGSNVCNLRLDFEEFELTDPYVLPVNADNGKCLDDQMTVTGVETTQFRYLCGKMPPTWHFYLDVRDADNPTTFNFDLKNDNSKARKWNIKVTQIDCERKIPRGCGQYFTGSSGDPLYSFNFGNTGMYLYGMNYGICFRQEKGYCTHTFVDNAPDSSWVVCPDSLAIPSADIVATTTDLKDCNFLAIGAAWPSPITTNNFSPTIIYHYTDQELPNRLIPNTPTPGFCFTWQANAC